MILQEKDVAMSSRERTYLCRTSEIPAGQKRVFDVGRRRVICVNFNGRFLAVQAVCPHRGADLAFGDVCGTMLESEPHSYVYGKHDQLIRCPWHGWQFDIETGRSVFDDRTRIATYPTEVMDGAVYIVIAGDKTVQRGHSG